jgi:hypothetical protein
MRISLHLPGHAGDDALTTVTLDLEDEGTPWPLQFHFLRLIDDESDDLMLVNVGFSIGAAKWPKEPRTPLEIDEVPEPVDSNTVRRIAEKYDDYVELARLQLVIDAAGTENAIRRLRGPGKKPARLTEDFYRLIAAEYIAIRQAGRAPGAELADKYHVDKGTVSRWVSWCRRNGLLEGATASSSSESCPADSKMPKPPGPPSSTNSLAG